MSAEKTREQLYAEKAVVILREKDADVVRKKAHAARDGGLWIQEITWTTPSVAELIAEFTKEKLGTIGAGTILTVHDARKAVDAGAKFLVSPIYTPEVQAFAKKQDVVYIPGCATPNDVTHGFKQCTKVTAVTAGASTTLTVEGTAAALDSAKGLTDGLASGSPVQWQVQTAGQASLTAT